MDYTQSKGNLTELQCIASFMEYGVECSIPYGNGAKYDFIADINGKLLKIQCKTAKLIDNNSFMISCVSNTTNTQKTVVHRYTKDMIDYFATWIFNTVFLIPVEECSKSKTLRIKPPENNNPNWNDCKNYTIEAQLHLEKLKNDSYNNIKYYCKNCGKEINKNQHMLCLSCYKQKYVIKVPINERPSREELKNMIRTIPFTQIASKYNVTDNAIRKWCDLQKLPRTKKEINQYSDKEWLNI